MKFGVIGSGSWGTALVKILTDNGHEVTWCVRSEKLAQHIQTRHHNPKYLSSVYFSAQSLKLTTSSLDVFHQSDAVVFAVPSAYVLGYIPSDLSSLSKELTVVSAVKGLLPEGNLLFNQWLNNAGINDERFIALMGPCHAEEVAAEKLSYLTFAGKDAARRNAVADAFRTPFVNTVTSNDVDGVQYAAVLKNVYALGTGISNGLGYGDNFQSVLIANAAGEMKKFLQAISQEKNINYAASVYLGDLLVTCYSLFSRNRSFGNMIGKGYSVEAAKISMQMVAEGYPASKAMMEINQQIGAKMPIAETIYQILWNGLDPLEGFENLEKHLY
jgi:glycerol-3-phosphate dehydrogenase (NAD(P)+)